MNLIELTDAEFVKFRDLIYRTSGIQIAENKRVLISNRVRRRLKATGIAGYSQYFDFLRSPAGADEMQPFLDVVTTNETYFYRDSAHYDWLGGEFLSGTIAEAATRRRPRSIRFWSAACSTGEEPYSIALKVAARRRELAGWRLEIVGTDLSSSVLAAARAAVYDERALHRVGSEERRTYFDEAPPGRWTLKPEIRSMVSLRPHNLLKPIGGEPFDFIFLKNVLIYFDAASKKKVVDVILAALAPGGSLVIGPTEGIHGMLGSLEKVKPWLFRKGG
ncbi:CheR family methyltransferase [Paludisphaera soli]|uniref:CheR family methyltransferase n=1 Tax=Paludisphaera soli TaxID=2712865 RepID=UPI0013ED2098|nr:protein-glutamate O-methyltransferase CheR [Paludisphaera soli]